MLDVSFSFFIIYIFMPSWASSAEHRQGGEAREGKMTGLAFHFLLFSFRVTPLDHLHFLTLTVLRMDRSTDEVRNTLAFSLCRTKYYPKKSKIINGLSCTTCRLHFCMKPPVADILGVLSCEDCAGRQNSLDMESSKKASLLKWDILQSTDSVLRRLLLPFPLNVRSISVPNLQRMMKLEYFSALSMQSFPFLGISLKRRSSSFSMIFSTLKTSECPLLPYCHERRILFDLHSM